MNPSTAFDFASFAFQSPGMLTGSPVSLLEAIPLVAKLGVPPHVAEAFLKTTPPTSRFPLKGWFSGLSSPSTGAVLLNWAKSSAAIAVGKLVVWGPTLGWFAAGTAATYGLGALAAYLVPTAMSWFGVVVPGVGTIHAAGGIAATLQRLAHVLSKPVVQAIGGAVGAIAKALRG